jgi:zinc protease
MTDSKPAPGPDANSETFLPQSTVLIVDDNPQNVELLQAFLESLPVKLVTAGDGVEALDKIREHSPDLILLDIMMPRMSGFQVCKRIKSDPKTKDIQVLMVTALNELGDIEQATECGTDDFVSKPVNKFELLTRVKSLLRVRHLKGELDGTSDFRYPIDQSWGKSAWTWALGAVCLCLMTAGAVAQTLPSGNEELLQNKSQMPGYGIETYRIVNKPDEIVSVLRNGATVICKRVASPVAAVRGYVITGGVYEGKWLGGGLSHLLEHLVAGGSSERRTETENKQLLQQIGNDSNAYTTYDHTAYFVNTTTAHFAQAVDLVTGWMLGAKITYPEYTREYQVVQRELERNKGNPDMVFWQLMQNNRYKLSPARVPVIGYQEVIQGLTRDDVYSYYQMAYQPNNMIFSVAANLDPQEMLSTLQQYLADSKPGRAFSRDIAPEPPVLGPRSVIATFPRLGQARLNLAFPSVRQTDQDMYPLDLLAQILGGGESSILVEQIRDQKQLCSAIECDDDTPAYVSGSFEVEMSLDSGKIAPATAAVLEQIEKIKSDGVDEDRLQRAKTQMKIAHLKQMQTSQDVAAAMGLDYLSTGDPHFSDRYVERIAGVTAQQVQAAAEKYLDSGKLLTTALVPREDVGSEGLAKAEDLLRGGAATQPAEIVSDADAGVTTRTVLDNGLVVLHRRITTTPLVQINMYALGGVTTEDADNNGIGNLAMSILSRGTKTRSAEEIANFFDQTGGDLKATCGNNTWYWNVTCTKDDLEKTMEVYSDVVNNPSFASSEVEGMRARTLAAIQGLDAAWNSQAMSYFKQKFYGPNDSPYQFLPIGSKENVSRFSAEDLKWWYGQKILAAPRVLAIFGDVDNATAVALAQKYFGGGYIPAIPAHENPQPTETRSSGTPAIVVDRVEIQKTDQELAGVMIGFESDSRIGEPDEAALTVAQCLTGGYGYPTGYIFETLRGQGWSYEAASINSPGRALNLPGTFLVYAGCDAKNVNNVVNAIIENMARLQGSDKDIQTDWFTRCKDMITTAEALQTETPLDQAELAATDELFGLGYDYQSTFNDRISAVTLDQVRTLAKSRLSRCVITICTPAPEKVDIHSGPYAFSSFSPINLTPRGVQHDVGAR